MEIARKINALVLGLVIFLMASCGKDDPAPNLNPEEGIACAVSQDSVVGGYSNKYFYNEQGQVTRIERNQYFEPKFETFEYDAGGKLILNKFYSHNNDLLYQYDEFQYNSNGQVVRINQFTGNPGGALQADGYTTLAYDVNGKLAERKQFYPALMASPQTKSVFAYQPDGSIVEKYYNDFLTDGNLSLVYIWEYRFDDKNSPYLVMPDGLNNYDSVVSLVAFRQRSLFPNNVLSFKEYDPTHTQVKFETNISYQYNATGYPVKATYKHQQKLFEVFFNYNCSN